jgi:hypothetical protein
MSVFYLFWKFEDFGHFGLKLKVIAQPVENEVFFSVLFEVLKEG